MKQLRVLRQFFRGYFHQDFYMEFRDSNEAISKFLDDATEEDVRSLLEDLQVVISSSLSDHDLEHLLYDEMGCKIVLVKNINDIAGWFEHLYEVLSRYSRQS